MNQDPLDLQIIPTRNPLLLAIIYAEGKGDVWSMRFEPDSDLYNAPEKWAKKNRISLDTEKTLQQCSFGLCHILGVTARDLGHEGPLPQLFDPSVNVRYGDKYLTRQLVRYHGDIPSAVAAYNTGTAYKKSDGSFSNQVYVDEVLKAFKRYQTLIS